MRDNQRGLRAVDDEARGALRRAGLEERRENIVSPGPDRKDRADRDVVFEVGGSIERVDRDAKRRIGIEGFGQRHFLGKNRGDRRIA